MKNETHVGVVLDVNEIQGLKALCQEFGVPILYPKAFEGNPHCLWGISQNGVGLLGTEVMRRTTHILHGLSEVRNYLSSRNQMRKYAYLHRI